MAFFVMSVKLGIYSCKVSSGHCFLCRSLAACTSVAIGEYTSDFSLLSGQYLVPSIRFSILYGVLVDLAIADSYSLIFVGNATFSIFNNQLAKSMFLPSYIGVSHMRLPYSCLWFMSCIICNDCLCRSCCLFNKVTKDLLNWSCSVTV